MYATKYNKQICRIIKPAWFSGIESENLHTKPILITMVPAFPNGTRHCPRISSERPKIQGTKTQSYFVFATNALRYRLYRDLSLA